MSKKSRSGWLVSWYLRTTNSAIPSIYGKSSRNFVMYIYGYRGEDEAEAETDRRRKKNANKSCARCANSFHENIFLLLYYAMFVCSCKLRFFFFFLSLSIYSYSIFGTRTRVFFIFQYLFEVANVLPSRMTLFSRNFTQFSFRILLPD